jgi:hypothetical protein
MLPLPPFQHFVRPKSDKQQVKNLFVKQHPKFSSLTTAKCNFFFQFYGCHTLFFTHRVIMSHFLIGFDCDTLKYRSPQYGHLATPLWRILGLGKIPKIPKHWREMKKIGHKIEGEGEIYYLVEMEFRIIHGYFCNRSLKN